VITLTVIRVLHSLTSLDQGSAAAMLMPLYQNIDRQRIQFDFVVNEQNKPYTHAKEIKALGGRIFFVKKFNGRNLAAYRKQMRTLFQNYPEWKVIHIHNVAQAVLFVGIAKRYQKTVVAHAHFDSNLTDFKAYTRRILTTAIKYYTNHLLACSKAAGAYIFRINKEEVIVLNNAINPRNYRFSEQVRRKKRLELGLKNDVVLGHVGSMNQHNNHFYLLDIFKAYYQENPRSKLLLIGEGVLKEELQKKVADFDLNDEVKFLGIRSDVNELMQAMDIFILPSLFKDLPTVLIEAQAAGLPIMASDRISKEVAITNLISFQNVDRAPAYWAKKIDRQFILFRDDTSKAIRAAGYDVKETAKDLANYYMTIIENGD